MNVNNLLLGLFLFFSFFIFGQESSYPKDTIFILFDNDLHGKKVLNHPEHGKNIYFKNLDVYYNLNHKPDTLPIKDLINYDFLDLEEINKKEWQYYKKRFNGWPIIRNKNWVFHTNLIEIISKEKFVIYPVVWRNEGVID